MSPNAVDRRNAAASRFMVFIVMLEPESRSELDGAHCSHGDDLPIGWRIYNGVDTAEAWRIKDIGELSAKFQRSGVAQGHDFGKSYVKQNLPWTFNAVAPSIPESTAGRSNERAGVKPLKNGGIGGSDWFARKIRPRCAVGSATDVPGVA